jgi:flagellar biosynthesis protein FlhF
MGPPGACKTVTAAKLAARARIAKRSVALITTDTLRTGAVEQFAGYAGLLGIDSQVADTAQELQDAVAAAQDAALILIDTTGVNPFDAGDMARLGAFIDASGAEPLLVLPAGMDADEAADMARAFAALGATRLLTTRLDTARRLGSLLTAAEAANLRLCDVGIGPHLADGLSPLNPLALARLLAAAPADRVASLTTTASSFAETMPRPRNSAPSPSSATAPPARRFLCPTSSPSARARAASARPGCRSLSAMRLRATAAACCCSTAISASLTSTSSSASRRNMTSPPSSPAAAA